MAMQSFHSPGAVSVVLIFSKRVNIDGEEHDAEDCGNISDRILNYCSSLLCARYATYYEGFKRIGTIS